jgi:hypothetical protein
MAVFFIRSELLPIRAGIRRVAPERTPHVLEPLDIFKMQEDGSYVWKAAAETFEVATSKIEQLASIAPGDYMIFKTQERKRSSTSCLSGCWKQSPNIGEPNSGDDTGGPTEGIRQRRGEVAH